jgi:hypothetical protein
MQVTMAKRRAGGAGRLAFVKYEAYRVFARRTSSAADRPRS